jgi:hypothetical protein
VTRLPLSREIRVRQHGEIAPRRNLPDRARRRNPAPPVWRAIPARIAPEPIVASDFPRAGQQFLNPTVASMFGESEFASGAYDLISCAFVLQISANEAADFGWVAINSTKTRWQCSADNAGRLLQLLRCDDFLKDSVKALGYAPAWIMRLEFSQIRNVANVVTLARFFDVLPI